MNKSIILNFVFLNYDELSDIFENYVQKCYSHGSNEVFYIKKSLSKSELHLFYELREIQTQFKIDGSGRIDVQLGEEYHSLKYYFGGVEVFAATDFKTKSVAYRVEELISLEDWTDISHYSFDTKIFVAPQH